MSKNGATPNDKAVAVIDEEMRQEEAALAELDQQRTAHMERIRALRTARRALVKDGSAKKLSPRKIAGPRVIAAVRSALAEGPRPQAEITRSVGANSGSVSYAIKALLDEGTIRDTGETEKGSKVFALVDRSVVPPSE